MSTHVSRHLLLSTLAGARRLRRGVALLACVGVLGWALLSATHWHDHDERAPGQHSVTECVLCLGSATGATPPALAILRLQPPLRVTPVAALVPRALASPPPSSYQSRAPPAA